MWMTGRSAEPLLLAALSARVVGMMAIRFAAAARDAGMARALRCLRVGAPLLGLFGVPAIFMAGPGATDAFCRRMFVRSHV